MTTNNAFQIGDKVRVITSVYDVSYNDGPPSPKKGDILDVVAVCASADKGVWIDNKTIEVETLNQEWQTGEFELVVEQTVDRKFKAKGSDTVYNLIDYSEGPYKITWTNSSGEQRTDYRDRVEVQQHFCTGMWYYLAWVEPVRLEGVVHDVEVIGTLAEELKPDAVNHPKHYAVFEQLEAIEVIASSMTTDQFYGYCLGNILKYRLRAGGKDDVMQELGKADRYQGLYNEFKHLCKAV